MCGKVRATPRTAIYTSQCLLTPLQSTTQTSVMYKLVVLSALLAVAACKPSHVYPAAPLPLARYAHGVQAAPAPLAYGAPAHLAYAAPAALTYAASAPHAYAAPAHLAYAAPAPAVYAAPAVAPVAAAAISKTVHYAQTPVVTGYSSTVVKPDLGHLATPAHTVSQTPVLAPARAVQTVVPQVTQVEPEVSVQKVPYDVPVHTPVVSEVEVRTPVVQGPAVIAAPAPVAYAAPAVHAAPAHVAYAAPAPVAYAAHAVHAAPAHVSYAAPAPLAHAAHFSYAATTQRVVAPAHGYAYAH